jgi:hypothetical protein
VNCFLGIKFCSDLRLSEKGLGDILHLEKT